MKRRWVFIFGLLAAGAARGDSLVLKGSKVENCRVTGIVGDRVEYEAQNRKASAALGDLVSVLADNQPAFNAGMGFLVSGDLEKAKGQFEKCVSSSPPEWVGTLANRYLVEIALKTGEFDQAIGAFVRLAKLSPGLAGNVAWTFPKANSSYLPQAIETLKKAVAESGDVKAKLPMAEVLLQLCEIKGEDVKDLKVKIAEMKGKSAPGSANPVKLRIEQIQADYSAKKYSAVIQGIGEISGKVFDEKDQTELLGMLARSREALLPPAAEASAWKSVALDYVRMKTPGGMVEAARIHIDKLNELETARGMLEKVIGENADAQATARAKELLGRIK